MDGDAEAARTSALELARLFWKHHEKMQVPLTSLPDAVRQAKELYDQIKPGFGVGKLGLVANRSERSADQGLGQVLTNGTVVLVDAADATSSGASGDSNAILAELMRQNYRGRALIPIVDPGAVRQAFASGVGATISTTVGGACDAKRFKPISIRARVRMLSDGKFRSESFGWHWDSGDTAVLEADNYTLIVGTRPVSLFDRSWFYAHGQDPKRYDLVVVKSPHCEHHMFAAWCARLINVDAPGSTSANLKSLGHTVCERPIFPLDPEVEFHPVADVFRRR
jgi:microcystin degradation protein MlrC